MTIGNVQRSMGLMDIVPDDADRHKNGDTHNRWSDKEIIEGVRELAVESGETLKSKEATKSNKIPCYDTIKRRFGGWNNLMDEAGLEKNLHSHKPDDLPDDVVWDELNSFQRHYYRNPDKYKEKRDRRRKKMYDWYGNIKEGLSCSICGEDRSEALDFHHTEEKFMEVAQMIPHGYGKERILDEIDKCEVLCANCHRVKHS